MLSSELSSLQQTSQFNHYISTQAEMDQVAKQNCIFELLKQYVSLNKVIDRNQAEDSNPND